MKNIAIIFPNQLFELSFLPYDYNIIDVFIITEDPIYFSDKTTKLKFNLLKLIYQRASMQYYKTYLEKNTNSKIIYVNWNINNEYIFDMIHSKYKTNNIIHIIDPVDRLLNVRIDKNIRKYDQISKFYDSPSFLSDLGSLAEYMNSKKSSRFYQYNFYIWQRKRLNILLDNNGNPIGGSYSYDKENRKPIPGKNFNKFIEDNNINIPIEKHIESKEYYDDAIKYVEKTFTNHYSENYVPKNIYLYPVTHADTLKHFKMFIKHKLKYFGAYQDAIDEESVSLFHSVISPQLNNGLITPNIILKYILKYYDELDNNNKKKYLFAVEGFIRQLNWREYSRLLYLHAYDRMISNYFNNDKTLNKKWYDGTTGIKLIDIVIKQAFQYGYLHHICRLMIMCNFMNLSQIHPDSVYKWFMEFSLDSYDWIMINNVYSMGMYADGGLTTTKVYISSSSYIKRQSNIKNDGIWDIQWTILYYYFIYRNLKKLKNRNQIYVNQWKSLNDEKKKQIIKMGKKIVNDLSLNNKKIEN